jgi:hypothetical protein
MILDTNHNVTVRLPALKAAGVTSIGRYIGYGLEAEDKVIKPAEARAIAAAGMRLFLIYEISGKPMGAAVGARDGAYAASYAVTLGAPTTACLFYAVDYDAPPADIPSLSAAFKAFGAAVRPKYRVGGYCSGYVCSQLFAAGLIDKRWLTCSTGFTGSKQALAAGAYDLAQSLPAKVGGLDTDPDRLHVANGEFGDFVPFSPDAPSIVPPAAPESWLASFKRKLGLIA